MRRRARAATRFPLVVPMRIQYNSKQSNQRNTPARHPQILQAPLPDTDHPLIACHECDLLQRHPDISEHGSVHCQRCNAILFHNIPDSVDRVIALSLAALILFIVANLFPFLSFEVGAQATHTTLITGVQQLYAQGIWPLAALVLFTCILAPLAQLLLMLYIFVPLKFEKLAHYTRSAFRILDLMRNWNMIDVFMIGILVALVKLTKMADIIPGIAMWSFLLLIFAVAGATASIDGRIVWRRVDQAMQQTP